MEANKILQADMLDLLFDGRNKDYGAYELRRKYEKRMSVALSITAGLILAVIGGSVMARSFKGKEDDKTFETSVVELTKIIEKPVEPPPPPPPVRTQQQHVEMARLTPPVIKPDEVVKTTQIPPVEDLTDKKIGLIDQAGVPDDMTAMPQVDGNTGVVQTVAAEPEDKVFTKVEMEASVDVRLWRRHLESQLQRYIEDAASQGMAPGQYTVQVRFLVERDGTITEVHALNDPGFGLGKGVEEVVSRGPKWNPGEQNGRPVRSYHTQPVTFIVSEQ